MSPGRVLVGMLLGLAGGVIGEIVDALCHLTQDPVGNAPVPPVDWRFYILGAVLGLCIGGGLGITEGLYSGSRTRFSRAAVYGALGGLLCGYLGFGIGGILYQLLGGDPRLQSS